MGAYDISFTLDGSKSFEEVKKAFEARRESDRQENGKDFQTVNTVVRHDKVFTGEGEAQSYCLEHAEKWESVVAVKVKKLGKLKPTANLTKLSTRHTALGKSLIKAREAYRSEFKARATKGKLITCKKCASRLSAAHLFDSTCPVCRGSLLAERQQKALAKIETKRNELRDKIADLKHVLRSKMAEKTTEDYWLVCGWGAS